MNVPTYSVAWKTWDPNAAVRAADAITDEVVAILDAGPSEAEIAAAAWWTWFCKEAICGEHMDCPAWRGARR